MGTRTAVKLKDVTTDEFLAGFAANLPEVLDGREWIAATPDKSAIVALSPTPDGGVHVEVAWLGADAGKISRTREAIKPSHVGVMIHTFGIDPLQLTEWQPSISRFAAIRKPIMMKPPGGRAISRKPW